ncbi:MAG: hypothetical protein H0U27_15140 [Nitrosopumilus sp.]|nr:hypothetical protein [Nitrosopumilus sp.]
MEIPRFCPRLLNQLKEKSETTAENAADGFSSNFGEISGHDSKLSDPRDRGGLSA